MMTDRRFFDLHQVRPSAIPQTPTGKNGGVCIPQGLHDGDDRKRRLFLLVRENLSDGNRLRLRRVLIQKLRYVPIGRVLRRPIGGQKLTLLLMRQVMVLPKEISTGI